MRYRVRYQCRYRTRCDFFSHVFGCQAVGRRGRGKQDRNIHLLKPARFLPDPDYIIPPSLSDNVLQIDDREPGQEYIAYAYRTAHPVLRWLPTKLAPRRQDLIQGVAISRVTRFFLGHFEPRKT